MKRIKKILTNYIFSFLFWNDPEWKIKDGELLECQGDLFLFDDSNGNPNWLKNFYKRDGFWNYIKAKDNSIFNIDNNLKNPKLNSQGFKNGDYYKNSIIKATKEEIKIYETRTIL